MENNKCPQKNCNGTLENIAVIDERIVDGKRYIDYFYRCTECLYDYCGTELAESVENE